MARELQRSLTTLEIKALTIQTTSTFGPGPLITPYFMGDEISRVPFRFPAADESSSETFHCAPAEITFAGTLRPEQKEVIKEAFGMLARERAALIAARVGFGKTIMALYILSQVKRKTVILIDLVELGAQWMEAVSKWLPGARATYLKADYDKVNWADHDIVVMNIVNVPKLKAETYDVGLLIVDETHSMMTPSLCPNLLYFVPQYLLGLSATPYRLDESHQLLELFYGKNIIRRDLHKPHRVHRVSTGIEIPLTLGANGRVNWGAVLKAQAASEPRNQLIANIAAERADMCFLILCKTIEQVRNIHQCLVARGVESEAVHGTKRVVGNARVLIGTYKKLGKGFDRAKFTALILAADIESYFIQALGRVFRCPDTQPVIFDLVDKNPILEKHWRARREIYIAAGGSIQHS